MYDAKLDSKLFCFKSCFTALKHDYHILIQLRITKEYMGEILQGLLTEQPVAE